MNTYTSKAQLYLLVQVLQLPYFQRHDTSWFPTMTADAAQIGDLIFQVRHSILLTFQSLLHGVELCLDSLCLLILQCNNFTAIIADLLFKGVDGRLNPLDDVEQVIVLASKTTLIGHQLLVDLLNLLLRDLQVVLRCLQVIDNAGPNIANGSQWLIGAIHEVAMLHDLISLNPPPFQTTRTLAVNERIASYKRLPITVEWRIA